MRLIISLIIFLTIISCKNENRISEIDSQVNKLIVEKFKEFDPKLWNDVEYEFYNRMRGMGIIVSKTDSLNNIIELMNFNLAAGYPKEYFIDYEKSQTKKLISSLEKIGYLNTKHSAHKFLYSLTNSIVRKINSDVESQDSPRDLLVGIATTDPDSIKFNFDLTLIQLCEQYSVKNLNRPGLYKTMLLLNFNNMITHDE
jgi:hypothetical protein